MICDKLENLSRYRGCCAALDTLIDFLAAHDPARLPLGRTEADGDRAFLNVMDVTLRPREQQRWECHQRYADLQLVLSGVETIDYLPVDQLSRWAAYDADRDIAQSDDSAPGLPLRLASGMFAVFFPWDAHRPGIGEGQGRKLVGKIRV